MTDLNNSNDDEERPNDASHGGGSPMDDLDAAWAEFADSHADDLKAVERSRSAKRFEKHAQRREKEALLSIDDLDQGTFTNDAPANGRGPRDFTGSSWLDTDRVMDRYGDDFVPPNPENWCSGYCWWPASSALSLPCSFRRWLRFLVRFSVCVRWSAPLASSCSIKGIVKRVPTNSMMEHASDDSLATN